MRIKQNKGWPKVLSPLLHLWPGVLTVALIAVALTLTEPVLAELPERLETPAAASAEPEKQEKPKEAQVTEKTEVPEEIPEVQELQELAAVLDANYEDGIYTGSAQGFGGLITVQVTVTNGQITGVDILSAEGETTAYFNLAMGVVNTVLTQQTWEVDAITGATYSSKGILAAIQAALTGQEVETEAPTVQTQPVASLTTDAYETPENGYQDGTYYGSATGFGGSIQVEVVISEGKIASVRVVSAPGETASYLQSATAVVDRILSAGSPEVDTVSGATYSSNGILNAVKRALSQAANGEGEEPEEPEEPVKPETPEEPEIPAAPETPEGSDEVTAVCYKDGVYTGMAEGFGGDITVQVTIENGRISGVEILMAEDETPAYLDRASALLQTIQAAQSPEVDVVSGATYSSKGILQAVRNALKEAIYDQAETDTPEIPVDPGESEKADEADETISDSDKSHQDAEEVFS